MISPSLTIDLFLESSINGTVIDVRSPAEYQKGHIPNAINIPLFDDDERAEIGIIYKMLGKENAVEKGLQLVSPKLTELVRYTKSMASSKKVFVYCWRGGMRSNSFAWLMNTSGIDAKILQGGYKKYRNHILSFFETKLKLLILGGPTGSGKSEVLRLLEKNGQQIIDLEKIARHKGSAFGSINEKAQLPQQLFEHHLFNAFQNLDLKRPVWLEDEAMAIGWNKIPFPLWKQMKTAPILKINVPFESRVERLVKDYTTTDHSLLERALTAIKDKLGGKKYSEALEKLNQGNLHAVASIALSYYDEAYEFNHSKREFKNIYQIEVNSGEEEINCKKVLDYYSNFNPSLISV